jgi:Domain of unknown function (DUF3560).
MRSDFHERREARQERYEKRAAKARVESGAAYEQARRIADFIPMGQPILVGHHSEKRHRRDLERIDNGMRKGRDLAEKAGHYEAKAEYIDNDKTIYSDDPDAIAKLKEKLEKLEQKQVEMKRVNAAYRKGKPALMALGMSESAAERLIEVTEKSWCKRPYEPFELSNNNQNIAAIKKRIKRLDILETLSHEEIPFDGGKIVQNPEDNRIQIFFDEIPNQDKRTSLKRSGFRWARSIGAWQRHLSNGALWWAKDIVGLNA